MSEKVADGIMFADNNFLVLTNETSGQ